MFSWRQSSLSRNGPGMGLRVSRQSPRIRWKALSFNVITPAHRERGFAASHKFEVLGLAATAAPPDEHLC